MPDVSTDETTAGTRKSCNYKRNADAGRLLLSMSITRDGATVAGSSQLPVRRHVRQKLFIYRIIRKLVPKHVESTRKIFFCAIGYTMLNRATRTRAAEIVVATKRSTSAVQRR